MAVRFDTPGTTQTNSDSLWRTASTPGTTNWSFAAWIYRAADQNAYGDICLQRDTTYNSAWIGVYLAADGTTLSYLDTGTEVTGSTIAATTWYHVGLRKAGATVEVYLNGVLDITRALAPNPTVNGISLGNVGNFGTGIVSEAFNGRLAGVKIYSAALSADELRNEARSLSPQRTANLWFWNPMTTDVVANFGIDFSGSGNTLTVQTSPIVEDGPPVTLRRRRLPRARGVAAAGIGAAHYLVATRALSRSGGMVGHVIR